MGEERVVIGSGPDALRAAAVLAAGGAKVTLLQSGATPSGLTHADLPVGTGLVHVPPEERGAVEEILGPLSAAPAADRGVTARGFLARLPMSPTDIPRLLPPEAVAPSARRWLGVRARIATAQIIGGGAEERTYRDWVVRRMGAPALQHLYRSYAERRWGAPIDELAASVARVHHGLPHEGEPMVPTSGWAAMHARAVSLIEGAGGSIQLGADVRGLRVEDGRVVAVALAEGEVPVSGPLWIARAPVVISGWLGEAADSGMRVDSHELGVRHALQVSLRGPSDTLPTELHVLDEGAPFYRVVRHPGLANTAVFHATLAPDAEAPPAEMVADRFIRSAREQGLGEFSPEGVRVERIEAHHPVWLIVCHARLRRVLLRWRALGIVGVGRAGLFSPLDAAAQIRVARAYRGEADPDQREVHRLYVEPPVRRDDLTAHITRFIER